MVPGPGGVALRGQRAGRAVRAGAGRRRHGPGDPARRPRRADRDLAGPGDPVGSGHRGVGDVGTAGGGEAAERLRPDRRPGGPLGGRRLRADPPRPRRHPGLGGGAADSSLAAEPRGAAVVPATRKPFRLHGSAAADPAEGGPGPGARAGSADSGRHRVDQFDHLAERVDHRPGPVLFGVEDQVPGQVGGVQPDRRQAGPLRPVGYLAAAVADVEAVPRRHPEAVAGSR